MYVILQKLDEVNSRPICENSPNLVTLTPGKAGADRRLLHCRPTPKKGSSEFKYRAL
jgi:hypothetical protein